MAETAATVHSEPSAADMRLIIAASSAGTIFEWYDFFIYGALGSILAKTFFPAGNPTIEMLLFWLVFAVGFGFRPLGAVLFGYLGDRLGRKYTFLVTVTLMGIATAGVGLVPGAAQIGYAAPILVLLLRVIQGLALGGEYGGAAIYVAEHAPAGKRGFYTSFIQASVTGGFVTSLLVVLACKSAMSAETWALWGWRVPFVLSLALLAVSLWMRLKLSESPVFKAMKEAGELSKNPFVESFTYPGNKKRLIIALFGGAAGMTVIFYTAYFSGMSFLKGPMQINDTTAEVLVGSAGLVGIVMCLLTGLWSDRVGRARPLLLGNLAGLILLFPLFWTIGAYANPELAAASRASPVSLAGPDCTYSPFAPKQPTDCGKAMAMLGAKGVRYTLGAAAPALTISVGAQALSGFDEKALAGALDTAGYKFVKHDPAPSAMVVIWLCLAILAALSAITYGSLAALLVELFPARVRYSSMSIPYHISAGYFGGFLPFIAAFIAAKFGNPYAGLWYPWTIIAISLLVGLWGFDKGPPRDFADDTGRDAA